VKLLALEVEEPGASPEAFRPHLREEAKAVWELYLSGIVREAYFRTDRHTAVFVLECPDAERARDPRVVATGSSSPHPLRGRPARSLLWV
jgi:hypothetical protein